MKKIFLTGSTSFLGSKFLELYKYKYNILGTSKSDPTHPVDMQDFDGLKKLYTEFQPDVIIHVAAIVSHRATPEEIKIPNIKGAENIINLAKINSTPLIFMSSESVYGGKEQTGEYTETDPYKPRSPYAETKMESEKLIMASGLTYLILRAHRFVGINKSYNKPKQFPDAIKSLVAKEEIHLDSHRLFKPTFVNHVSDVFAHYIDHDISKKIVLNIGVDKATTYYDFIKDVANVLALNQNLIKSDGEESAWPENSTLSLQKIKELGYPMPSYDEVLATLKHDWLS